MLLYLSICCFYTSTILWFKSVNVMPTALFCILRFLWLFRIFCGFIGILGFIFISVKFGIMTQIDHDSRSIGIMIGIAFQCICEFLSFPLVTDFLFFNIVVVEWAPWLAWYDLGPKSGKTANWALWSDGMRGCALQKGRTTSWAPSSGTVTRRKAVHQGLSAGCHKPHLCLNFY